MSSQLPSFKAPLDEALVLLLEDPVLEELLPEVLLLVDVLLFELPVVDDVLLLAELLVDELEFELLVLADEPPPPPQAQRMTNTTAALRVLNILLACTLRPLRVAFAIFILVSLDTDVCELLPFPGEIEYLA